MSAGDGFTEDTVIEGNATRDGVTVTVTLRIEPKAFYSDVYELGEVVGARAATMLGSICQQIERDRQVPF